MSFPEKTHTRQPESHLETTHLLRESSLRVTYDVNTEDSVWDDDDLEYSREEEDAVRRIIDVRLMPCILLTTFVLNMDRTNNSNAISDNLPSDLGFNIDVVNTATALHSVFFASACLAGPVMAKIVGPSRWIPILMLSWGIVTLAHVMITDKFGYLTVIAITEGGVTPTTLVYLGGFYKSTELATRLAWFWGVQHVASAMSGLMASGLLKLRGFLDLEGWKWLFLVDGVITVVVAVSTWFYLPSNLALTKGGLRGGKDWFTPRQVQIAVTRVIRDDISKKFYDKKVEWSDVKDALTDLAILGHLIITMIGQTPNTPMHTYLPTVIKSFNFNTSVANALTAPPYILQGIVMIIVIHHSDKVGERGYHGAFGGAFWTSQSVTLLNTAALAGWQLIGWIFLRFLPSDAGKGVKYLAAVIVASWPSTHPLNIAWMSENTGSVGKRTVASGLVIGASNIYGVWGSQIYRADDAPDFRRGNMINIIFAMTALALWFIQKDLYRYKNSRNEFIVAQLNQAELAKEEQLRAAKGNSSPLFKFTI